jgi:hypothetical protein
MATKNNTVVACLFDFLVGIAKSTRHLSNGAVVRNARMVISARTAKKSVGFRKIQKRRSGSGALIHSPRVTDRYVTLRLRERQPHWRQWPCSEFSKSKSQVIDDASKRRTLSATECLHGTGLFPVKEQKWEKSLFAFSSYQTLPLLTCTAVGLQLTLLVDPCAFQLPRFSPTIRRLV